MAKLCPEVERKTSIFKIFPENFIPKIWNLEISADEERQLPSSSLSYHKNPPWLLSFSSFLIFSIVFFFSFVLFFKGYLTQPRIKWSSILVKLRKRKNSQQSKGNPKLPAVSLIGLGGVTKMKHAMHIHTHICTHVVLQLFRVPCLMLIKPFMIEQNNNELQWCW